MAISNISSHANQLSKVVYPKLLGGGKKEHLQENQVRMMYFLFPFVAISITFARPGLFAFNPIYESVWLVVIFLSFKAFFRVMSKSFTQGLQGIEKIDMNENANHLDYIKSSLFKIPTIRLIQRSIYLASLIIMLIFMKDLVNSELELVVYWSAIAMIVEIPFTINFLIMVRKKFQVEVKGLDGDKGGIMFTSKEWNVANNCGTNYYLAIVRNVYKYPKIQFINNPAAILKAKKSIFTTVQVRWNVAEKELF